MTKHKNKKTDFLQKLIDNTIGPKSVGAFYQYAPNPNSLKEPGNLKQLLGIEDSHLSSVAKDSLKILKEEDLFKEQWIDLKWKIAAYLTIQDTFSGAIHKNRDESSFFRQWYFYYEAKYILTEAILCGFNGFSASINMLLRLFLEFSLLQNYSFLKIQEQRSFSILEDYFEKAYNPNWSTVINGCVPTNKFCKPIKKRLKLHLDGLSKTSAHPYQPMHSPKHIGSFVPEQSLGGLYFPIKISSIIEPILWVYFVNFPMLFHPVDVQKKFGFNYPIGLFIDKTGAEMIRRSVSKKDYCHFHEYSQKTSVYEDLMAYYESMPDMTAKQIKATWDSKKNGELKDLHVGHCMQMSKFRAIGETLALEQRKELPSSIDEYSKNFAFDKWRKFYKET